MDEKTLSIQGKLWLERDGKPIAGEGKIQLLKAVVSEKSINKAAKKCNISYKHAWKLIHDIEKNLGETIIETTRGGKDRGTRLTENGLKLIEIFEKYQSKMKLMVQD